MFLKLIFLWILRYNYNNDFESSESMKMLLTEYEPHEMCRIIREWTDLTQNEFGKTINRSDRSIRLLESGKSHLTVETLVKIAKTHGIKITIEKEVEPKK